jgi:23S rRNA pseudouridine2605 synthase
MEAHPDKTSGADGSGQGERIAKVLARAGVASRREVERMIEAGRIALNGQQLTSPAVKVGAGDVVTLDGRPVSAAEPTRLFLHHKRPGLVTTHRDPKGRPTLFEALPPGLPRLISVGRLDLNSEGLILLTNDGGLARALELPATGLVRRYRARARGRVDPAKLEALRDGITVAGVRYGAIEASLDVGKEGAANIWITLSLAEGKNREVRKVLEALGLTVNRLIRTAYGPFELGDLPDGAVREVEPKRLRELLGKHLAPGAVSLPDAPPARKPGWAKPRSRRPAPRRTTPKARS